MKLETYLLDSPCRPDTRLMVSPSMTAQMMTLLRPWRATVSPKGGLSLIFLLLGSLPKEGFEVFLPHAPHLPCHLDASNGSQLGAGHNLPSTGQSFHALSRFEMA
jgi:hypothetical protein